VGLHEQEQEFVPAVESVGYRFRHGVGLVPEWADLRLRSDREAAMTDPDVWKITVVLRATDAEQEQATEAIARALCPDQFHAGPCPTPWAMITSRVSDCDDQDEAENLRALIDDV